MVRQLFEDWIAKSVLVMGTWATGAQIWFQARTDKACEEHEHWLSVTPEERAALEKQYMLGETIKVPDANDQLESLFRVELLEVIPQGEKQRQEQSQRAGQEGKEARHIIFCASVLEIKCLFLLAGHKWWQSSY
eukprot:5224065-Amphidinium_carterae.1